MYHVTTVATQRKVISTKDQKFSITFQRIWVKFLGESRITLTLVYIRHSQNFEK